MATVKFKDTTLTLLGSEVKSGQTAPDFKVQVISPECFDNWRASPLHGSGPIT